MNRDAVTLLGTMTGVQIAEWCAEHGQTVMIDFHRSPDGTVYPIIRAYQEPAVSVDLPALLRRQAD